jgi:hypothetical protein
VVNLALIREFRYEYAAVSPWDGYLDFMTAEKMRHCSDCRLIRLNGIRQNKYGKNSEGIPLQIVFSIPWAQQQHKLNKGSRKWRSISRPSVN